MSTWERTNRLERELLEAKRVIERLTAERDLARSVACKLEAECHDLAMELETAPMDVVMVPMRGEAT